ncbi:hypothetical protein ABTP16_18960, partial [Acinetobacter baumannii]
AASGSIASPAQTWYSQQDQSQYRHSECAQPRDPLHLRSDLRELVTPLNTSNFKGTNVVETATKLKC